MNNMRTWKLFTLMIIPVLALLIGGCGGYKKTPEKMPGKMSGKMEEKQTERPSLYTLDLGDASLKETIVTIKPGEIINASANEKINFDEMIDSLLEADVVYLGESHTSMNIHQFQAKVIKALAERGKQLIIGMEFFYRTDDPVLAEWSAGNLTEEQLIIKGDWYGSGGYNFGYYAPLLDVARENGFPVVGINVDRMVIRAISRGGLESLDDEQKALVGDVDVSNGEHRKLIMFYFGGAAMTHGQADEEAAKARLNRMYAAQCAWDQVFADSTKAAIEKHDGIFVTIVGSGHVAYKLGTNRRLAETSDLKTATVYPVLVDEKPEEEVRLSIADYIVAFEDDMDPEFYPSFGISAKDHGGVIVTGMLFPGSLALKAGLQKDDVIVALNGEELKDATDLRIRLAKIGWDEPFTLTIHRGEEAIELEVVAHKNAEEK